MLKDHRVDGLRSVAWAKPVEQTTHYVGRGRGSLSREKRVIQKTRYQITHLARQEDTIAARRSNSNFGSQDVSSLGLSLRASLDSSLESSLSPLIMQSIR